MCVLIDVYISGRPWPTAIRACISDSLAFNVAVPFKTCWVPRKMFQKVASALTSGLVLKQLPRDQQALPLYLIETPFNTFVNKADPDQAAALSGPTLFANRI